MRTRKTPRPISHVLIIVGILLGVSIGIGHPVAPPVAELQLPSAADSDVNPPSSIHSSASEAAVERCVARGIGYFKGIGSFPQLSAGQDAMMVAAERCKRTTAAF